MYKNKFSVRIIAVILLFVSFFNINFEAYAASETSKNSAIQAEPCKYPDYSNEYIGYDRFEKFMCAYLV